MNHGGFVVAQLGARMHYAVPRIMEEVECLSHFFTDVYASPQIRMLGNLIPTSIRPNAIRRFMGRVPVGIPDAKISAFPWLAYLYAYKRTQTKTANDVVKLQSWIGRSFSNAILKNFPPHASSVYGFNTECLELFESVKRRGVRTVLEQANAPKGIIHKFRNEEMARFEGWEQTTVADEGIVEEICDRERREWGLSDLIICGSEFVKQGIAAVGGPVEKCAVVPYGVDFGGRSNNLAKVRKATDRTIKVLTVGSVDLRKGAPYTLLAAKKTSSFAQYKFAGVNNLSSRIKDYVTDSVEFMGQVPRSEIRSLYDWADVFLLPSVCEGSATVIYEALSYGLPVVTTANSGSVVRHGVDGFIVPIRDPEAIADAIERLATDSELYNELARNALVRSDICSVNAYKTRLLTALASLQ